MLFFFFCFTGNEKSKNGKDVKTWSTADHKPVNQCYSLNVVLQCSVSADGKPCSKAEEPQSPNKEFAESHEPETSSENCENEQRTVKFASIVRNQFS